MRKFLILMITPLFLASCGKSNSSSGSGTPVNGPNNQVTIDKATNPNLYNFLYQNSCTSDNKATYWFGYIEIQTKEPGIGGLRVVVSVHPDNKSISIVYRASVMAQGYPNDMTLKHDLLKSGSYAITTSSIDLDFEGFKFSENEGAIFVTVTKDNGPLKNGDTLKLESHLRTYDEIENFIGTMGFYASDFPLNCD